MKEVLSIIHQTAKDDSSVIVASAVGMRKANVQDKSQGLRDQDTPGSAPAHI